MIADSPMCDFRCQGFWLKVKFMEATKLKPPAFISNSLHLSTERK